MAAQDYFLQLDKAIDWRLQPWLEKGVEDYFLIFLQFRDLKHPSFKSSFSFGKILWCDKINNMTVQIIKRQLSQDNHSFLVETSVNFCIANYAYW